MGCLHRRGSKCQPNNESMFDKAKLPNRATTPDAGLERSDQRARSSNPVPDSYTLRPGLAFSTPAPQNYSLTPGPSTPAWLSIAYPWQSFLLSSIQQKWWRNKSSTAASVFYQYLFHSVPDVTSSTWMQKYFHATSSCWTGICCALHCDQSRTEYTCNPGKSFASVVGPPPLMSPAQLNVNPFYTWRRWQGTFRFARVT